jgi:hypothetical protein
MAEAAQQAAAKQIDRRNPRIAFLPERFVGRIIP